MKLGVFHFNTEYSIRPDELAVAAEERGFESLWFPEHTHIPASRLSEWPGRQPLPREYVHMSDPFVSAAAAAVVTNTIKLGTGICLVVEHEPLALAKTVATVDRLSNGRFMLGVGAGWNREEMGNHGTAYAGRMKLMRERVEAMKAIWTQHEASYEGEHVSFQRIWSYPKPVQSPYPPILVGGHGEKVLDRVLAFGDGWFPNWDASVPARFAEAQARADRPIALDVLGVPADPKVLEQLEAAGARRACTWLPSGHRSTVERALEDWERAIGEFTGT